MSSSYDDCSPADWENSKMGLRIAGVFIILFTSMFGVLLPILLRRNPRFAVPKSVFDFAKYTGSGVIIATAFIHLLPPAFYALSSKCLKGTWQIYPWPAAIAMFSIFALFIVEFFCVRIGNARIQAARNVDSDKYAHTYNGTCASHEQVPHDVESASHDQSSVFPYQSPLPHSAIGPNHNTLTLDQEIELSPSKTSYDPSIPSLSVKQTNVRIDAGQEENILDREARERDAWARIVGMLILEFGIVFHSIFIGLMLATDRSFTVIFIVIIFHQAFEGLGLGARLAFLPLPARMNWIPIAMGVFYAALTPIGMAIGLGARYTYQSSANGALIATGVLDSISAGILLWTSLVELMAHEFLLSPTMLKESLGRVIYVFSCILFGCALMAVLGKWA
ncbi:Fe2 /Zn2 regulated transporter [Phaffia rhodozyma]|uniref:Fe2 /Zn2 regulated transporter n=1 Tax=Phaffia rhodozyma TaxID=264483 RepID=A0A0F7SEY8_PHARH|nr:Fe2 /Zn2 regulated transporter [Phaffia rhodozyma]